MTGLQPWSLPGGVVAAAGSIEVLRGCPVPATDLRAAARLPAWRVPERLAARALLRHLVAEVAGERAAASPLAARAGGQPYLATRPDLGVSVSHAGGWVAAAVRPGGPVGVDVQVPLPVREGLLERCCTPSARRELARLSGPVRDEEFAWIWSVQEACVKAAGAGVAGRPWTIPVEVGQLAGRWRGFRWSALRGAWPVPVSCAHDGSG